MLGHPRKHCIESYPTSRRLGGATNTLLLGWIRLGGNIRVVGYRGLISLPPYIYSLATIFSGERIQPFCRTTPGRTNLLVWKVGG